MIEEIRMDGEYSVAEVARVLKLTAQAVYNRVKLEPTHPCYIGSFMINGVRRISGQELIRVYNQKMAVN